MSHTIEISDDIYQILANRAAREGKTPETLVREWATSLVEPNEAASDARGEQRVNDPRYDPWAGFRNATTALSADSIDNHDAYLAEDV